VLIIDDIEAREYRLSYDKIIKNALSQSNELTIRFVNGLFGGNIPLDTAVTWLDKNNVNDKPTGFIADFYPQIAGRVYHIKLVQESDDNGDMAVQVDDALLYGMAVTDAELNLAFPQQCVIFLKNGGNMPKSFNWNINFFDGQKVTLHVPTIRLAEMSVQEIAARNLLPIGQFYMRTFEPLTYNKMEDFRTAAASLLTALKESVDQQIVPYHIGLQMQETIRMTVENTVSRSRKEVSLTMDATSIMETLPWIDFSEVFKNLQERSKAEGIAEGETKGRTERNMEIASKAFERVKKGANPAAISQTLLDLGIPENIIEEARKQAETERVQTKKRGDPERG